MLDLTPYIPMAGVALTALIPALVAFVAGIIRQDGLPKQVNEGISYGVVILVALLQALAGGKLGGSTVTDFMIVAAYSQALLHSPMLQGLQGYLQGNVINVVKGQTPVTPVAPPVDASAAPAIDFNQIGQVMFDLLKSNGPQLAQLVSLELSKQFVVQPPPPVAAPAPVQAVGSGGGGQYTSGGVTSNAYPGYPGGSNLGVPSHVDELPTRAGIPAVPPDWLVRPNRAG